MRRMVGAFLLAAGAVGPASAQSYRAAPDTVVEAFDSSDVAGRARARQAAFERRRARLLPRTLDSWASRCDEIVGRFCEWYDEGEWTPDPEPPEIGRLRRELVAYLDSVAELLPGDDWLLGQRVWYRGEGDAWTGAAATARACGGATPWWCAALEGLALHGLGDYDAAGRAFDAALEGMPSETARRWRVPDRAVRGGVRDLLDDDLPADSLDALLARLWTLADPLYLVDGNDRRTAHFARWTLSTIRDDARNPFGIRWGRDLEELTVRHGWEMWWERRESRDLSAGVDVVGHKHPQGREFLPDEEAFRAPWAAPAEALVPGKRRPRSLYAPEYAPVFLPMDGQMAVFPRGDRVRVVATTFLPPDTTTHAEHTHPVPWLEAGDQADEPERRGLVLMAPDGSARRAALGAGAEGALVVEAPAGRWVASAETWSPPLRRAGRHRRGVATDTLPPDLPVLSDLLLVAAGSDEPVDLEAAATGALPRPVITAGQAVGVVWEVTGLGFGAADMAYRLSVTRDEGGFLRSAGRWLGIVDEPRTLRLAWEEPGPDEPSVVLRRVDVASETLEPGTYDVRLEIGLPGRGSLISATTLRVEAPR